ncbi:ABC transporter ATP-binding protein [Micromonospora okii]|uniref:ABC transporter ATP-binding protein n=1 Tax=Micromonospora okii TaxID=1182970 RepID=UPI001E4D31F3|nr:ABC transporter ATP-binding protein [Micromonospora okii]
MRPTRLTRRLAVLRHVLRLSWRVDRRTVVAILVLMTAQAGVVAVTGLSQRWLVDASVGEQAWGVALAVAVGALALGVGAAAGRVQVNMLLYLVDRVQLTLHEEMLTAAATMTIDRLEEPRQLDRLERLRFGAWDLASSVWQLSSAVAAVASLAVTAALLATVDVAMCLLVVGALPALWTGRRAEQVLRDAYDACTGLQRREQRLHELCLSPESGRELALSGGAAELDRRAGQLWHDVSRLGLRARLRASLWESSGWLCFGGGLAAALSVLVVEVRAGTVTLGDTVLVVSLAARLHGQLGQVVGDLRRFAGAAHVVDHYAHLRDAGSGAASGTAAPPQRLDDGIHLAGVGLRYPGADRTALHGLDLTLPAGATVAVVGVNGAGKSTLVNLLTGLYQPTTGVITVDGRPLADFRPEAWRARVAPVYQDFVRFQFRLREAVGVGHLPALHDAARVSAALRRAGADRWWLRLPGGMETQLGGVFGGWEPSGGQWQQVALSRALLRPDPLLMVLDEPTAALDPDAEEELFVRFAADTATSRAERGTITVLVSHRLSSVRMADLVVVLDDGRLVESGTHDDLMAAGGGYAQLYRTQADAHGLGPARTAPTPHAAR